MIKRTRIGQPWFLAAVLGVGFAIVWAILIIWISSWFDRNPDYYKQIVFVEDGTPIIVSAPNTPFSFEIYETLDDKRIPPPENCLFGIYFARGPGRPAGFWDQLSWRDRLVWFGDENAGARTLWYLIHDGETDGNAHFVGYDNASRQCIGYIGQRGFQRTKPTPEESFPIHGSRGLVGLVVSLNSSQREYSFYASQVTYRDGSAPPCLVYLISGDRLVNVDLRDRSVRVLRQLPGMLALERVSVRHALKKSPQAEALGKSILALRTDKDVSFLDSEGKTVCRYVLPKTLRHISPVLYPLNETTMIAQRKRRLHRTPVERCDLVWFNNKGTVEKEVSVDLPSRYSVSSGATSGAVAVPVPVMFTPCILLGNADSYIKSGECPNFPNALAAVWSDTWPSIVLVNLLGVALAYVCYRRQRRYDQRWTWVWVVSVFLFGLPGLVGYWFHRRWPPIAPCPNCQAAAPRDRPACFACTKDFPKPAPKGTEVFA